MPNDKHDERDPDRGRGVYIGGNVTMGNGNRITGGDYIVQGSANHDAENELFASVYARIAEHSHLTETEKNDLRAEIEELRKELGKRDQADESFLMRRFRNISRIAPDILDVTLATLINPILGLGVFARKLAEKARSFT